MLAELKIHNYALIRELDISFLNHLNTITGETGTGKSIMLGALGLILGNRADTSALLDESRKCVVEGRFDIGGYNLKSFFEKNDLDYDDNTLLRREISPSGKSRAFINDTPVNLNLLKELGENLVDIHSQHQTMRLASPAFQISLLDAFAGHKDTLEKYTATYREYRKISKQLNQLREDAARAQKEYDYNLFQLEELTKSGVQPGEQESLEEELNLLSNAETIKTSLQHAVYLLYEDERSVNNKLSEIRRQLSSLSSLNPRLESLYNRVESLIVEVKDIYSEADDFSESVNVDNRRMTEVSDRLQLINHLLGKHGLRKVEDLILLAEQLEGSVNSVDSMADDIVRLEKEEKAILAELDKLADQLTANRQSQIPKLEENMAALLRQVGIPEAQVIIRLTSSNSLTETGRDVVEILFSANKGSRPGPVTQVASGGELSRIMLCLKYILAESIFLPTLIFDEIDTGVSGEVAIRMGQMMKRMAAGHQIITITHQPQVAALGAHHFVVYKTPGEDITTTHIRQLAEEERVGEIAKMIAGHKPSAVAIESARELLAAEY